MITKSVDELMTEYGFKVRGACRCDGYETIKYKKDGYLLKWRKYKYVFSLDQGRYIILGWTKVDQLEAELKKIFNVAVQTKKVKELSD